MAKKVLLGTVVSDKMMNTVVVEVERHTVHPLYKKRLKVTKKYSVDSQEVPVTVGDFVKIEEMVPMSKTKFFKVTEKISEDVVLKLQEEVGEKAPDTIEKVADTETVEAQKPVAKAKSKTAKTTKKAKGAKARK